MYKRFFQRSAHHHYPKINHVICRSHHQRKPEWPKWEIAELVLMSVFGFYTLFKTISDDRKKRIAKEELEAKTLKAGKEEGASNTLPTTKPLK